jgi:hypothetical protein
MDHTHTTSGQCIAQEFYYQRLYKPRRHLSLYHLIWDLAPFVCARGHMVDHMPTDLAVRGSACPNHPTVRTVCAVAPDAEFLRLYVRGG